MQVITLHDISTVVKININIIGFVFLFIMANVLKILLNFFILNSY